jgi:hypothetical protein
MTIAASRQASAATSGARVGTLNRTVRRGADGSW